MTISTSNYSAVDEDCLEGNANNADSVRTALCSVQHLMDFGDELVATFLDWLLVILLAIREGYLHYGKITQIGGVQKSAPLYYHYTFLHLLCNTVLPPCTERAIHACMMNVAFHFMVRITPSTYHPNPVDGYSSHCCVRLWLPYNNTSQPRSSEEEPFWPSTVQYSTGQDRTGFCASHCAMIQ